MSLCKSSGLAIFAVCLLGETTGSAHAQCYECAIEWSGGNVINLVGLPGSTNSEALGINNAGRAVGVSHFGFPAYAVEWSGGNVINLGGLPGSTNSEALGINDAGRAVGYSEVGNVRDAVEWSGGNVINLGGLPGSQGSIAYGINNAGQVVGASEVGGYQYPVEWNRGQIINLAPGSFTGVASSINDAGRIVGTSYFSITSNINEAARIVGTSDPAVPEAPTWAMMLLGFAGLGLAGYRRAKAGPNSRAPKRVYRVKGASLCAFRMLGRGRMSLCKEFGLAIFAAVYLLCETTSWAQAQASFDQCSNHCATEWSGGSVIDLGPGIAYGINNAAQVQVVGESGLYATEWSGGSIINLGSLPGSRGSAARSINDAGQAVGVSYVGSRAFATEWSDGSVINLGGLPGSTNSFALGINDAGQVVEVSDFVDGFAYPTEWSDGSVINLGGLSGSGYSLALGINDVGQAVGYSMVSGTQYATEWSEGSIINLGPGVATDINDAGQVANVCSLGICEWSINDAGQVVGLGPGGATEWSDGSVINLGGLINLAGYYSPESVAYGINDAGQVVGYSVVIPIPQSSTWAMMLLGFAGLGLAGYRRDGAGKGCSRQEAVDRFPQCPLSSRRG